MKKIVRTMNRISISTSSTKISTRSSSEAEVDLEAEEEEVQAEETEDREETTTPEEKDGVGFETTARRKIHGRRQVPRNLLQAVEGANRQR